MTATIFIFLVFLLQGFYWLVGKRASKNLNTKEDYFLAGKAVRFFPLMMTFLATQVGGGVILGAANEAYLYGWPVFLYPLGASLGLILLGAGVGRKLAEFKVSTVAEIFEVVYKSPLLRKVASVLSVASLFMILVAQIVASDKFLISMGLDNKIGFIIFWAIVIIYTAQGGLKAVISTDIVQAAFFSIVFFVCFALILFSDPSSFALSGSQTGELSEVSPKLFGWLMMPLLFMVIEQDMGQRCFAGDSPKTVSKSALVAGLITMAVCIIPVFIGTLARASGMEVPQGGSVLMTAIQELTNPLVAAIVGCAVLAAVISTATSLINAISSNVSSDFDLSVFERQNPITVVRIATTVISVGAIFFAFYFDNIIDLLIISYELCICCLFVPISIALFKKQGNPFSAGFAILFGGIGFFLFRFYPIDFPKELASLTLSLIGFMVGTLVYDWSNRKVVEVDRQF